MLVITPIAEGRTPTMTPTPVKYMSPEYADITTIIFETAGLQNSSSSRSSTTLVTTMDAALVSQADYVIDFMLSRSIITHYNAYMPTLI